MTMRWDGSSTTQSTVLSRFSSRQMGQGSISVMLKQTLHSLIFSFISAMLLRQVGHVATRGR